MNTLYQSKFNTVRVVNIMDAVPDVVDVTFYVPFYNVPDTPIAHFLITNRTTICTIDISRVLSSPGDVFPM